MPDRIAVPIFILSSEFPPGPGGIGTHAYQLAAHLAGGSWQVAVMSPQDYATEEAIQAFNEDLPFSFFRLERNRNKFLTGLERYKTARKAISDWNTAVLVASGKSMVWLASLISKQSNLPLVAIGHGLEFGDTSFFGRTVSRLAYNRAKAIVCVSEYTRNMMWQMDIRSPNDVVIHNGADETVFRPQSANLVRKYRRSLGLEGAKVLLTVGNTTLRKGQDIVIRALPEILTAVPNVHYLIVGLLTGKGRLSQLALSLGVGDQVHFTGPVVEETLVSAYNACDVYVMTSRHAEDGDFEGYGIAAVEAALCGKPAVVTEGSGLAEAILPDVTGLLVPQDDPSTTAGAILKLFQNEDLRQQMGEQARKRALAGQTWSKSICAYQRLLWELVGDA